IWQRMGNTKMLCSSFCSLLSVIHCLSFRMVCGNKRVIVSSCYCPHPGFRLGRKNGNSTEREDRNDNQQRYFSSFCFSTLRQTICRQRSRESERTILGYL